MSTCPLAQAAGRRPRASSSLVPAGSPTHQATATPGPRPHGDHVQPPSPPTPLLVGDLVPASYRGRGGGGQQEFPPVLPGPSRLNPTQDPALALASTPYSQNPRTGNLTRQRRG